MGDILPLLYDKKNAGIWFDVTSGQNSGNGEQTKCPASGDIQGFYAKPGWDAASGLGTLGTGNGYADYASLLAGAPPPILPPGPENEPMRNWIWVVIGVAAFIVLFSCCCGLLKLR